jgi:hypothetical protein
VLVTGDGADPGRVKIADFGLARVFQAPVRPLYDNGVVVTIWWAWLGGGWAGWLVDWLVGWVVLFAVAFFPSILPWQSSCA